MPENTSVYIIFTVWIPLFIGGWEFWKTMEGGGPKFSCKNGEGLSIIEGG